MKRKAYLIIIPFSILAILILGCGCTPPGSGKTDPIVEEKDPWYTEGFTKGDVTETNMLLDLISSFSNQVKNASTQKVNDLYPQYSLDFSFNLSINGMPLRIALKVNADIENFANSGFHLAAYRGDENKEKLYFQVNVLPIEDEEERAELFFSLKGEDDSYTKVVMEIDSEDIFKFFPLVLGKNYDSTISTIAKQLGSVLSYEAQPKYEYKRGSNNSVTRHYNVTINLKKTVKSLVESIFDMPFDIPLAELSSIKKNLEFFFINVLGSDIKSAQSIENTMPTIQIELDFITEKGLERSFNSNNSILSRLNANCIVSEDPISKDYNDKFRGERFEMTFDWNKISVKRALDTSIPQRSDFKKKSIDDSEDEDAYVHYNSDMPLALYLEGKYEGAFVEEEQNICVGFKHNYYEKSGIDDEFCFKVYDNENDVMFSIFYYENEVFIDGIIEESYNFPFSSWEFINGEKGKKLVNSESLLFKLISYLLGAISIKDTNEVSLTIRMQYLSEILDIFEKSFGDALNEAYTASGGTGVLTDILLDKGINVNSFLSDRVFKITFEMDSDFLKLEKNIPSMEHFNE